MTVAVGPAVVLTVAEGYTGEPGPMTLTTRWAGPAMCRLRAAFHVSPSSPRPLTAATIDAQVSGSNDAAT